MSDYQQVQLEFTINTSPKVLYYRLSTPSGLSEWFADDVNIKGDTYTFIWDGSEEQAELVAKKENVFIKYKWLDEDKEDTFLEFRISVHELTGDVALMVTDFVEKDEVEEGIELWTSQVDGLKHSLGL
ncbi:MAG: SRPBCC domain-containing protein [Bacteroidales bacterium]|nr:SRPBCC domain-containing protein [Bacteroidales bacterium]MCF8454657.1 SRPBCC domain-containing protein [Bacteroidales bacterium]